MERKAKNSFGARFIVGIVFTFIGIIYLAVGTPLYFFLPDRNSRIFSSVFSGLGMVFLILGIVFLILEIKKKRRCNRLLHDGNYITAEISEISLDYGIRVNRRHPYVVICRYRDMEGTVHMFKSRNLYFNPGPLLQGQTVKIYVDGKDFRHYYMDIDEVLPKVIRH